MNSIVQRLLTLLFLLCSATLACAQADLKCAVCQARIQGQYHLFESASLVGKRTVCEACTTLESVCFICNLPVKKDYQTLEDGRFLCEEDKKSAVFSQNEAERIWAQTRRDLEGMLSGYGTSPKNFTVSLVDRTQMGKVSTNLSSWHDKNTMMGLTQTHIKNHTQFDHKVFLLNGVSPARLAAVSAHEYGHAWLHENTPAERHLETDTVEGFCELVAFKLMIQRNESVEQKVILANTYTHGQIHTLLQADDDFRFFRVVDWVKTGVDDRIDKSEMVRLLKLRQEQAAVLALYPPAPPTPVPDTLMLKGISGTATRRFALINNCTLAKNEEGKVRVGKTNVVVRCLEISAHSVVIQARGSAQKVELTLQSED